MSDYLVYSRLQTIHNRHTSQQAAPPDTTLSHWTHTISTHKANDLGIMSSLVTYRSSGTSGSSSSNGGESSDDGGNRSDDVEVTRVVNVEATTDPSGNANQDSERNHKGKPKADGSPRPSAATATGAGSSAKSLPGPRKPSYPRVGVRRFHGGGGFYHSFLHGQEAGKFLQRPYCWVGPSEIHQGERIRAFVLGFRKYCPAVCCVIWCITQRSLWS